LDPSSSRSMCCLSHDTQIIHRGQRGISKISIGDFGNISSPKILYKGKFYPATWFKSKDKIFKVTLSNNLEVLSTPSHPNITQNGIRQTKDLTTDDWLPLSLVGYEGKAGTYDLGRFIGLYVAEGSKNKTTICYSLNPNETEYIDFIQSFSNKLGYNSFVRKSTSELGECSVVYICSETLSSLISDYVLGDSARNKHLASKVFGMSREFRKGLLDGWMEGDGGSKNRIYTVSKNLQLDGTILMASLGMGYSLGADDRTSIDGRLGDSPVFWIRPYSIEGLLRRGSYGDFYKLDGDILWLRIKSIIELEGEHYVYDFDMDTEEESFQLANGIITHNCRLNLNLKDLKKTRGGYFSSHSKTGSIGVVTLNLPRIGYLSKNENDLFTRIEENIKLASKSLEIKRSLLEKLTEKGLYPYTKKYLSQLKELYGSYWSSFFSTIGILGLNECLLNFTGNNIVEEIELAEMIMKFLRFKVDDLTLRTGNLYNLEETPAEGCCYSLALKDKKEFPDIISANPDGDPFFTNSSHLPVNLEIDLYSALRHQERLQQYYSGGSVFHVFLGESNPYWEGISKLVRRIAENFKIPYFTITPTFSLCPVHGYFSGEIVKCPQCGLDTEIYSRITGYYRPVQLWNKGKQAEFKLRKQFKI